MRTTITTEYEFCSAHFLPFVPEHHKCRRIHGHNYKLCVSVSGEPNDKGMLLDFFDLDAWVKPYVDAIDHRCLNACPGLENPTAELIAAWFHSKLVGGLPEFELTIRIYETPTCFAEVCSPP